MLCDIEPSIHLIAIHNMYNWLQVFDKSQSAINNEDGDFQGTIK